MGPDVRDVLRRIAAVEHRREPGELVTCTFNNRKRGNITVNLDTRSRTSPQDFAFTTAGGLTPSSFQLDDDGDSGNELSNTRVVP